MALDEILTWPNGANPFWADLAIKTPASPDYRTPDDYQPGSAESQEKLIARIIESAVKNEIGILGAADYNLGLEERGIVLDQMGNRGSEKGVSVYPGARLLLDEGLEFVALFEPGRPQKELSEFITALGLPPDARFYRNNKPVPLGLSPRELVARIREQGGMVLLIHTPAVAKHPAVIADPWVWGVILSAEPRSLKPAELQMLSGKTKGSERRLPMAMLAGSFAASPAEVGSRKVSVKLGTHNLEGLRIALLDSGTKVRFPYQFERREYSKLLAARWEGGFLDGLGINFNPGFNAMIGGRGTGKTTVIETLRYVLAEEPKTDRNRENQEQILRDVFLPGSKLSLLVESHEPKPKRYVIERIYPFEPVVRDAQTGDKLEVNPRDIFRAEVFGNKEIYEISKQQDFQLRLLERLCEKDLEALQAQEELLIQKLAEQTGQIEELTAELSRRDSELGKLSAAEEKLSRFLEMDIPAKIEEKRHFEQERGVFERGQGVLAEIKKMLTELVGESSARLKSLNQDAEAPLNPELLDKYTQALADFSSEFERGVGELIAKLNQTETGHQEYYQEWEKLYQEGEERFKESLRSLQERFPGVDINEYISLEREVTKLRERKAERDAVGTRLSMARDGRRSFLDQLRELRGARFEILNSRVKGWNKELEGKIRVELSLRGDARRLATELRGFLPDLAKKEAVDIVTQEDFSFDALAEKARAGDREGVAKLLNMDPERVVPSFDTESLYRMEMVSVPPEVRIQLNLGTTSQPSYRDVAHLSDGQRCTAILGILLLESPYPLIVDQPEEDLDNAFIVEEIAERFRVEMDKRQFLVATHNANIPVLGDASQILALEADVDKAYLKEGRYGYLDSPHIKETVEKILEGGRQAFEIRKEKYGL